VSSGIAYYYLAGGYQGAGGSLVFHLNYAPASPLPSIVSQPANRASLPGGSVTFNIGATGSAPLTFYWRRNGLPLSAGAVSSYTINNVQLADSGSQFSCLVSNAFGTVLSATATLTVNGVVAQNGGFETGDFSSWTLSGNADSSSAFVTTLAGYVHSGNYGAELGPYGSLGFLSQSISTIPGQTYLISCWVYSDGSLPNEFSIGWNGARLFDQQNLGALGWIQFHVTAAATASITILQLGFRNDPSYLGLDDISVVPVAPPMLNAFLQPNRILQLSWNTVPGVTYQVQSTTDLQQKTWSDFGAPISANGTTLSTTDFSGSSGQLFYRVVIILQGPSVK
jgi:hypothetical protein